MTQYTNPFRRFEPPAPREDLTPAPSRHSLFMAVMTFLIGVFALVVGSILLASERQIHAAVGHAGNLWIDVLLLAGGGIALVGGALWLSSAARGR